MKSRRTVNYKTGMAAERVVRTRPLAVATEPVAPRPERTQFQKLTSVADDMLRQAEYAIEKFKTSFEKEPAYALEWSANIFQSAADLAVAKSIIEFLTREATDKDSGEPVTEEVRVAWITEHALDKAMREARDPSHSTSVQSNEMSRATASAWAKVYDKVVRGRF
jgi:hypothetical protein